MFSKAIFVTLFALALSTPSFAAPAAECPAKAATTSTSTTSSSVATSSTTSIAKAVATGSSTSSSSSSSKASFGKCSTPEIKFGTGFDGRKETAFEPTDLKSFNHGSADAIDVISSFICGQLKNNCKANAAAISLCSTASAAADKAAKGTGAQADAFNNIFGIETKFSQVTEVNNQGKAVAGTGSSSSSASSGSSKGSTTTSSSKGTTTTSSSTASSTSVANNVGSVSNTTTTTTTGPESASQIAAAQLSLTLDPNVIAVNFSQDGQAVQEAGQVASLTSTNNFINFCLTVNKPITNGQQITTGSCNPAPMGVIASSSNMPSSKFAFPKNFDTIKSNTPFTVSMNIQHLETGNFVNAASNYYAAPQQVNAAGDVIGHSHFVIEEIESLSATNVTDPTHFAFFKGVNEVAQNGVLTADVTAGLPAGFYKMSSINAAANHQPVLVAIAQHGGLDDCVYFTVSDSAPASSIPAADTPAPVASSAAPASTTKA